MQKVIEKDRITLLEKKIKVDDKNMNNNLFLTCTFRPNYQKIPTLVKKNWDILARSCTTKDLHTKDLKIGYRRPKNLKDFLVRSRTDYHPISDINNEQSPGTDKNQCKTRNACRTKNCEYCNKINTSGKLTDNSRQIETKIQATCNSSNLIYCLECKICNKRYVGQTKRRIKDRMREHFYNINKKSGSDVAQHFNDENHKGIDDVQVYILDYIYKHPDSQRAKKLRHSIEYNWIQRLKSQAPKGMNIMDNKYG